VEVAVQKIEVAGEQPAGFELADFFGAASDFFRGAVEDGRGAVRVEEVAGHHVAAKEQIVFGAVKPAMAERVTRQMHDLQSTPERQLLAVGNEFVDFGGMIAKDFPARGLEPAAPAVDALIGIGAIDVLLFVGVGVDFCAGPVFEPREVAGVVEMAVGEQDGFEGLRGEIQAVEQAADEKGFADQAGVDHRALVAIVQEEAAAHEAADGIQVGRDIAHASVVTDRGKQAVIQKIIGGDKDFDVGMVMSLLKCGLSFLCDELVAFAAESGAEATALQTLRDCRAAGKLIQSGSLFAVVSNQRRARSDAPYQFWWL